MFSRSFASLWMTLDRRILSRVQFQNESGAFLVFLIQTERAVQLVGDEGACRQSQTVALGQILDFGKWLEQGGKLFFWDACAGVGHNKLS